MGRVLLNKFALLGLVFLLPHVGLADSADVEKGPGEPLYSLDFGVIDFNATAAESDLYSTVDYMRYLPNGPAVEKSADYELLDPLASRPKANNGVVINLGHGVQLLWTDNNYPAGSRGFNIYSVPVQDRPASGEKISPEFRINTEPWTEFSIVISPLEEGYYLFLVFLVDKDGYEIPWTDPIDGLVSEVDKNSVGGWLIYD